MFGRLVNDEFVAPNPENVEYFSVSVHNSNKILDLVVNIILSGYIVFVGPDRAVCPNGKSYKNVSGCSIPIGLSFLLDPMGDLGPGAATHPDPPPPGGLSDPGAADLCPADRLCQSFGEMRQLYSHPLGNSPENPIINALSDNKLEFEIRKLFEKNKKYNAITGMDIVRNDAVEIQENLAFVVNGHGQNMIFCCTRTAIEAGEIRAGILILFSGVDQSLSAIPRFYCTVLPLQFDDVAFRTWTDRLGKEWFGPNEDHLRRALEFWRDHRDASVAVHCNLGNSRSSAMAVILVADRLGPGQEAQAVDQLIASTSHPIAPNPFIIRMADRLLGRDGRIEAALERACPAYVTWRAFWRAEGLGVG
jgi:predicted protein tyrosine phosphatase